MNPALDARCPNHPEAPAVGNCTRCGAFVCAAEWTLVDAAGYCPPCAARDDIDYLEAFRKKYWGRRDAWAWMIGLSAPLQAAGGIATLRNASSLEEVALGLLFIGGGINSAAFWWGVRLSRWGLALFTALWSVLGLFTIGPAIIVSLLLAGASVRSALVSTRTKLFFKMEVPREALRKAWDQLSNNLMARNAFTVSMAGLLVPGLGPIAVILGVIALSRVNRKARPPVGKMGYAIAGIVLGLLGSVIGTALVLSLSRPY